MTKADPTVTSGAETASKKKDALRIGIIGCGSMGQFHATTYSTLSEAEVVAVSDLIPEKAKYVQNKFGIAHSYTDYKEMLAKEKLDAVTVAVPNCFHAPVSIAALQAGCHVMCEKPMANNAQEAQKIFDVAKASDKIFMMGFNNRYRGDSRLLKKYIEQGRLGDIYMARCGWIRTTGIPGLGSWFTTKEMSGGGPLVDIGVHVLDLTLWLMGNPKPVSAYGSIYAKFGPEGRGMGGWGTPETGGKFNVEDLATAMIKLENGATIVLEASWASYIKEEKFYSTLMGTKGGADLDPLTIYTDINDSRVEIAPQFPVLEGHQQEVLHFIDCIRNNKTPISTAQHGLDIMKILDGVYESARTGKSVSLI